MDEEDGGGHGVEIGFMDGIVVIKSRVFHQNTRKSLKTMNDLI
jgi:hypothetical protein